MSDDRPSQYDVALAEQGVDFPFDEVDREPEPDSRATDDALQILRCGLLVILDSHRDSARTRTAALARLCGLFDSDADAAAAIGLHRATLSRAVARMRCEIRAGLCNVQTASEAKPRKASPSPRPEIVQPSAH